MTPEQVLRSVDWHFMIVGKPLTEQQWEQHKEQAGCPACEQAADVLNPDALAAAGA